MMRLLTHRRNILFLITALILISGCGKKAVSTYPTPMADSGFSETNQASDRMLIWFAQLILEVDHMDDVVKQVGQVVANAHGYIESNSVTKEDAANFTIRIPSDQLNSVLDQLSMLGIEKRRDISSTDVTEKYVDTEARLKNKISLRDRLKDLLTKADKVSDILDIEKEISRIQSDIDSMEGMLKSLKGKVDYATIDLKIEQKTILGPLGYLAKGIGWVIKKLFVIR